MLINLNQLRANLITCDQNEFLCKIDSLIKDNIQYCSFDQICPIVSAQEELLIVLQHVKHREILFSQEGIVRLMVSWSRLYMEKLKSICKEYSVNIPEEAFELSIDETNELRKALRDSKENFEKLHIQYFFDRFSKLTKKKDKKDIGTVNARTQLLRTLELALYL